jgi:ABC-type lipoprotein release transport system permease subunit
MALGKLWTIAWRDLGRNRRRTLFSIVAVGLGLALLIVLNGFIAGVVEDSLQNSILFETGHVQLRAVSYDEDKVSLQWKDLLEDPEALVAQARAMPEVKAAAPVLWASGVVSTQDESTGIKLFGIDTESALYDPFRQAMVAGDFLAPDDRSGILIGKRLADSLGLGVGDKVNLAIVDANGQPSDTPFTIRGLFATGFFTYDDGAVLMPLSKAQAYTVTEGHASTVVILLNDEADAGKVASALQGPGVTALTYLDMNQVFLETMSAAMGFYVILYGIVILVVAVIIANTLLMAVFERIREMGILSALGMKGRQIALMFLLEAAIMGLVGVVVGLALGSAGVAYLATSGVQIGSDIGSVAQGVAMGSTLHARFNAGGMASLSIWTMIVMLLASLYPARFASRLEPVEALRAI